jgi:hypothetical protein
MSRIGLAEKTNNFQDLDLIANSLPLTRQEFNKQVSMFKALSLEKLQHPSL